MDRQSFHSIRENAIAFSERMAQPAIAVLCALHLLLGATFLFSLALAAQTISAGAEQTKVPRCEGRNLVEVLRSESPGKLVAVESEAAQVENGGAIFWNITRADTKPSWLLGTMHSPDPRIVRLPEPAEVALERSDTILIENTEALDPAAMARKMAVLRDYVLLADGQTLDALVDERDLPDLQEATEARNMPWQVANRMQPWMVAAAIAVPACDAMAKSSGAPVLDALIAQKAIAAEKELIGLETVEEQFKAVASIPFDFHVNALNETLQIRDLADDLMETTKILYLQGQTGMMLPLVRAFSPKTYDDKGYAAFQELLLTNRNHTMAERAEEYLADGNAFIAVGALHLPGQEGLVNLLRQAGYTVEAVLSVTSNRSPKLQSP